MRYFMFFSISLFSLWVIFTQGQSGQIGFFTGIAWTAVMVSASGISWKWLLELAKKIEDQGGSIFKGQ